jgi:hypothetical protein
LPNPVLTDAIDRLASREHLPAEDMAAVLAEIMAGNASETETAAVLIALRTKGETVDELVGLASTMRRFAAPVKTGRDDLIDTAGTGGGRQTFNVSTTAALIAAGAGCAVAKHGNRSATGLSGSADLLEALGVTIDLSPEAVTACIDELGFGFMFAPRHHAAMRYVVPVRKELAVRTIFNFLGPLTNPAGAVRQLLGVSDRTFQETLAEALIGFVGAVLVGYSFTWISAFAGLSLKTVEAVQAATFTLIFPIVFASSAFVPDTDFPGWLQVWSNINPVSIWSDTFRVLTLGELYTQAPGRFIGDVPALGTLLWQSAAWFVGILALFVPLGVRVYRRT